MKTPACVSLVHKQTGLRYQRHLRFFNCIRDDMAVLIETSLGDITVDLFTGERPRASLNFLKLCKTKYYNFCLFHSVQRNLVAQTGDPTGTGRGGQSVFADLYGEQAMYFDMETVPRIKHRQKGLVSMVNNGNNGHGSQFFFTLGEDLDYLDGVHTVIGEIAEGLDVLDKINEAYCDEQHRPYKDIRIYHTIILDDPLPDPEGLVVPDKSPEPTKEQLDSGRIGADEDIDDNKGLTEAQVQESLDQKEAQANAQILEMVGDLPDADVKPPDTVLFVCKLNPVTTSEDLEIIFSRFGTILSCEVIKEQKTEESLQYAFIEFEKPEDCESAYFKMDNVLIDDRRIHVDFSQSVSKLKFPDGKAGGNQGMFGPQYKIKDTTKKDQKYDLVFEEESHKKSRKDKSEEGGHDRKRRKSRSRSRDRSPVGRQNKRSRSRSPKRNRGTDRRNQTEHSRDDRYGDKRHRSEKHRKNDDLNYRKEKRRGSSAESLSDSDRKDGKRGIKKIKDKPISQKYRNTGSDSSDSESNHRKSKTKSSKSSIVDCTKAKNYPADDGSSPDRFVKKSHKRKQKSESDSSSDERSKAHKKSADSHARKYRDKNHRSDSESDNESPKPKHRRGSSRERNSDKYEKSSRDKGKRRDLDDKSYRNRDYERHDYDSHSDRKERQHRERR